MTIERVATRRRRRQAPILGVQARCAIAGALQIVGDRWTLLIIRDLLRGRSKFVQLAAAPEGITRTGLSERLKALELDGIVERHFYSEHPPRAEYRLTAKGRALGPALGALARWGTRYLEHDTTIVSSVCGHELRVAFECPICGRKVPAREARITQAPSTADLSAPSPEI